MNGLFGTLYVCFASVYFHECALLKIAYHMNNSNIFESLMKCICINTVLTIYLHLHLFLRCFKYIVLNFRFFR